MTFLTAFVGAVMGLLAGTALFTYFLTAIFVGLSCALMRYLWNNLFFTYEDEEEN